jgi:bifunctional DNA-binding transcriptional regulator/antitoxin component of YhaV-PrlF toxin-antitoxin module
MMEKKAKIKIPEITRVSSKGHVVIPKIFREALKREPGTPLAVEMRLGMLVMKPIRSPIEEEDLKILEEVGRAWEEIERGVQKRQGRGLSQGVQKVVERVVWTRGFETSFKITGPQDLGESNKTNRK